MCLALLQILRFLRKTFGRPMSFTQFHSITWALQGKDAAAWRCWSMSLSCSQQQAVGIWWCAGQTMMCWANDVRILYYYFLIIFPRRNHFFLNLSGGKMINNWIRILLSIIFTNSNPIPTHYNYFSPSDRSEGGATHFLKSWVSLRFCVCKVSSPGGLVPRAGKKLIKEFSFMDAFGWNY